MPPAPLRRKNDRPAVWRRGAGTREGGGRDGGRDGESNDESNDESNGESNDESNDESNGGRDGERERGTVRTVKGRAEGNRGWRTAAHGGESAAGD